MRSLIVFFFTVVVLSAQGRNANAADTKAPGNGRTGERLAQADDGPVVRSLGGSAHVDYDASGTEHGIHFWRGAGSRRRPVTRDPVSRPSLTYSIVRTLCREALLNGEIPYTKVNIQYVQVNRRRAIVHNLRHVFDYNPDTQFSLPRVISLGRDERAPVMREEAEKPTSSARTAKLVPSGRSFNASAARESGPLNQGQFRAVPPTSRSIIGATRRTTVAHAGPGVVRTSLASKPALEARPQEDRPVTIMRETQTAIECLRLHAESDVRCYGFWQPLIRDADARMNWTLERCDWSDFRVEENAELWKGVRESLKSSWVRALEDFGSLNGYEVLDFREIRSAAREVIGSEVHHRPHTSELMNVSYATSRDPRTIVFHFSIEPENRRLRVLSLLDYAYNKRISKNIDTQCHWDYWYTGYGKPGIWFWRLQWTENGRQWATPVHRRRTFWIAKEVPKPDNDVHNPYPFNGAGLSPIAIK